MIGDCIEYFFRIAPWTVFIPLIIGMKSFSIQNSATRQIVYYLVLASVVQTIAFILWQIKTNNLFLSHLYPVAELYFITRFYHLATEQHSTFKWTQYAAVAFAVFAGINAIYLQTIQEFSTYASSVKCLLLLVLSIQHMYFTEVIQVNSENGNHTTYAKINYGILVYNSGALALFSFGNLLPLQRNLQLNIWTIHLILLVLLYLFITNALWTLKKQP